PTPTSTLTPTATLMPTPTPLPSIHFTNIKFNGTHAALKSLMFWAIYHETSDNRFYSGNSSNPSTPFDIVGGGFASFLQLSPYCDTLSAINQQPNIYNGDGEEPPGVNQ